MHIDNRTVALVTGASGGLGRATARLLGKRRANVILLARGREGLEAAKREVEAFGGHALVVPTDVSKFEEVRAAADAGEQEFGPVDLWINNAMVSMYSPFLKMTPEEFRHIVDVTFLGSVYGTHCALERMMPRDRGVIIQVGSALAFRSIPLQSGYCASKHALEGFVESVRTELIHEKSKVRITVVNMPAMNTTQFIWTKSKMPNQMRPTGTIFQPEVGARAILFGAEHDRREIMVGYTTVEASLGEKLVPGLLDHYLAKKGWEGSMLAAPTNPDQPDNFWRPVSSDYGVHGPFDENAYGHSIQLWGTEHRRTFLRAVGFLAIGAAAWIARSNYRESSSNRKMTTSARSYR
jgi:short-subunit dehydrogenase